MATFTQRLNAEMTLMEDKELIFGVNMPGEDKLELCKRAIDAIKEQMEYIEKNPENYKQFDDEDGNTKFQLRIELSKLKKSYFDCKK